MKNIFLVAWLLPLSLGAQNWDAAQRFSAAVGSTLSNAAVATAPDGSTYLAGNFKGKVTFDSITFTPAGGNLDSGYLVRLDPNFQVDWAIAFPQKVYTLTTDHQGNVFVAGSAEDTLSYVAKYTAQGQLLSSFTSVGGGSYVRVVRTDAAGNCYLACWVNAPTTFGAYAPIPAGGRDNYLVKLDPTLNQVHWAVLTGASSKLDEVYDLEIDDNGYVYTSGNYAQSWNLFCFCYNGSFFVQKHDAANGISNAPWKKIFSGGSGTSTQQFLSRSADGQTLYTTGSFKKTVTIEPGASLTADAGTDDYHIFAAALNTADLGLQWAQKVSLTGDSYPQGMVQVDNHLLLHGSVRSTALMGITLLTPQGGADPFTVQLAPSDGTVEAAETFGGSGADYGYGIDTRNGVLVVSGNASSPLFSIDSFVLPGNSSSVYLARKYYQQPPLEVQNVSLNPVSCPDGNDGSATVAAQGGTAPYTYSWSTGANTSTIFNLSAGQYTVTVTDASSNTSTLEVNLPAAVDAEPPMIIANDLDLPLGASGSIQLSASLLGAVVTDNCTLSTVSVQPTALDCADLGPQPVTITATDLWGNTSTATLIVTLLDLQAPAVTCPGNIIRCPDENLVEYDAPVATDNCLNTGGGEWTLLSGLESGAEFPAGESTTVTYGFTDASGNMGSCSFTVTIHPDLLILLDAVSPDVGGQGIGNIQISLQGGTAPFGFIWSKNGQLVSTAEDPTGLTKGFYDLQVTDANACIFQLSQLFVDDLVANNEPVWMKGLVLAPNPTGGIVSFLFSEKPDLKMELQVFDLTGRCVLRQLADTGTDILIDGTRLPAGVYTVLLRSEQGVGVRRLVVQH